MLYFQRRNHASTREGGKTMNALNALEQEILKDARVLLDNQELRMEDILAWSKSEVNPWNDDELVVRLDDLGVNLCVKKKHDKRT
jgi:hypothetical protein